MPFTPKGFRPAWATLAWGIAFWLALATAAWVALQRERSQALDFAQRSSAATVALLELHTAATFRAVDLALEDTAERVATQVLPRHDEATRAAMRRHLRDMPYVRALFTIGPDGFMTHDTDHPKTRDVSLADRDYFKAHEADARLLGSISAPLQSRSGMGWFVAVTRRVGAPGEFFQGVAVAAIQLSAFSDLYTRMGLTEGQRIALYHRNGTLVAQYPPDDARIGKSYANDRLFRTHLPQAGAGTYLEHNAAASELNRIVSYRALLHQPLVVVLTHDTDAVLAAWRRTAWGAAIGLAGLLLVTAAAIAWRLRAEAERQRAQRRIAQGEKLEALGRLTSGIAHDFNNVLGIIGNSLSLIAALPPGQEERAREAAQLGRRAVATGARLTRDLLNFARQRELRLAPADLSEAVAQMRPMLEQAAGPQVSITTALATDLHRCQLDFTQLQVTLINLVVNARDAMQGNGRIHIRTANADPPGSAAAGWLASAAPSAWVMLSVTDTGAGMPEEVRRQALEPFFTTKGEQGTGLGLAQVHGFMHQLDGEVDIASRPGQGTTVSLYFRALPVEAAG